MEILSSDIKGYYYYKYDDDKTYKNNTYNNKICAECKICRCSLNEPSYEQKIKNSKILLPIEKSIGKCGHIFHTECINEWIKTKQICPIDFCPWKIHITINDTNKNDISLNDFSNDLLDDL